MGGQPGAFGANRVLDHLHHQLLAFAHQIGNSQGSVIGGGDVGRTFVQQIFRANVRDMQERRPLQANVHKCGFHAGQYPADLTLVNIADQAAFAGPFNENFLEDAVLHHRDPGFTRSDIDQNFVAGAAFGACAHTVGFRSESG